MLLAIICAGLVFVLVALLGLVHFTRVRGEELTSEAMRRYDIGAGGQGASR